MNTEIRNGIVKKMANESDSTIESIEYAIASFPNFRRQFNAVVERATKEYDDRKDRNNGGAQ